MSRSSRFTLVAVLAMTLTLSACGKKTEAQKTESLFNQAVNAQAAGDLETATTKFNQVIVKDPLNKVAYYDLGLIQQNQSNTAAAEKSYRKAIEIDANYAPALYNLAILRANAGAKDEAVDLYKRSSIADPTSGSTFLNLGLLLEDMGKIDEGKDALRKAIALDANLLNRIPAGQRP